MIKFSILATGSIAHKMAKTVKEMPNIELYACASRSLDKAKAFQKEFGFTKAYGSYDELVNDSRSDIVYVATPHTFHYQNALALLRASHNVLCEKPIGINAQQAKHLYEVALQQNVLFVDATWTRYMPFIKMVNQMAQPLGKLKMVKASLGISKLHSKRMVDPKLGGGALLDLGIYPLNFALIFAQSHVESMESFRVIHDSGVDETNTMMLNFENGVFAQLSSSMNGIMDPTVHLSYEKGRIELDGIPNPQSISVFNDKQELVEKVDVPKQISGYEYEVQEMIESIEKGLQEMPSFTKEQSIEVLELMDSLRHDWQLVYPDEQDQ